MQRIGLTLIAMTIAVVACGSEDGLEDTQWQVQSLSADGAMRPALPGVPLTADFALAELSGFAGCNTFNGSYSTEGDRFTGGPFASTLRACEPPVMEQEQRYLTLLESATQWERSDDRLELKEGGEIVIELELRETPELDGTSWLLTSYNNQAEAIVSVIIETSITMDFAGDTVSGSSGCNDYTATKGVDGSALTFGSAAGTEAFCTEPDGLMDQEAVFLSDLGLVASHQFTPNGNLEMLDAAGGLLLVFAPGT